jgi:hypothetical protein
MAKKKPINREKQIKNTMRLTGVSRAKAEKSVTKFNRRRKGKK